MVSPSAWYLPRRPGLQFTWNDHGRGGDVRCEAPLQFGSDTMAKREGREAVFGKIPIYEKEKMIALDSDSTLLIILCEA